MPGRDRIDDELVPLLLRYVRRGTRQELVSPRVGSGDREFLRLAWARGEGVSLLVDEYVRHPSEVRPAWGRVVRSGSSIRGVLDTRASALLQARSGNPGTFVFSEPQRMLADPLNRLLFWTLRSAVESLEFLEREFRRARLPLDDIAHTVRQAAGLRRVLDRAGPDRAARPPYGAAALAQRSRGPLYRAAADAYRSLELLEHGDEAALRTIVTEAVVGPLEGWRRFELWVALKLLAEIGALLRQPVGLRLLTPGIDGPIGTAGPFAVWWQASPVARHGILDPYDVMASDALAAHGIAERLDRPDLVVVRNGAVVAVVEVKHTGSQDAKAWRDPFAAGVRQVVRYARQYAGGYRDVLELVRRSAVVVPDFPGPERSVPTLPIGLLKAASFDNGSASALVARMIA